MQLVSEWLLSHFLGFLLLQLFHYGGNSGIRAEEAYFSIYYKDFLLQGLSAAQCLWSKCALIFRFSEFKNLDLIL